MSVIYKPTDDYQRTAVMLGFGLDHRPILEWGNGIEGKGVCILFMEIHLTTTECHLPYGITQCYLPPDTSEHTPPLPQPDRLILDLPTI